jgi:hypothetical protein
LLRLAVFLALFVGLGEVWLRVVMPACELPLGYQDTRSMIMRFDPHGSPTGLTTDGRTARRTGRWRINGAGWNSTVEYVSAEARHRPLVALLGDSYVEGFLTDVDQHVDVYLSRSLTPATDVYAFGRSGWYLAQYVAVARYVADLYQPDVLVVLAGHDDVTDSVRENGVISPYLWQVSEAGKRFAEVAPMSVYAPSDKARLARRSAIVRYLRYNVGLTLPGMENAAIAQPATELGEAADESTPSDDPGAWRALLPAAESMIDRLCAEHPGTPIVIVNNGDRYLPVDRVQSTPLDDDVHAIRAACEDRPQCHFLDLRPMFSRDWAAHRRSFEAADGSHWNAYANRLVADELARFITERRLLSDGDSR